MPEDGIYTANVTLEGGTGRASVESPAFLRCEDGKFCGGRRLFFRCFLLRCFRLRGAGFRLGWKDAWYDRTLSFDSASAVAK